MTRTLIVDEAAQEEAEAQTAYYVEHAGSTVALRFVAELEAIYRGLIEARCVGVNHPRVKSRVPVKTCVYGSIPVRRRLLRGRRDGPRCCCRGAAAAAGLLASAHSL